MDQVHSTSQAGNATISPNAHLPYSTPPLSSTPKVPHTTLPVRARPAASRRPWATRGLPMPAAACPLGLDQSGGAAAAAAAHLDCETRCGLQGLHHGALCTQALGSTRALAAPLRICWQVASCAATSSHDTCNACRRASPSAQSLSLIRNLFLHPLPPLNASCYTRCPLRTRSFESSACRQRAATWSLSLGSPQLRLKAGPRLLLRTQPRLQPPHMLPVPPLRLPT